MCLLGALCRAELPDGLLLVVGEKRTSQPRLGRSVNRSARRRRSLAKVELGQERVVAVQVRRLQVREELATTIRQHDQTATGVEILAVGAQVLGQVGDAGGDEGDLDFRGAGILGILLVLLDDFRLIDGHGGG